MKAQTLIFLLTVFSLQACTSTYPTAHFGPDYYVVDCVDGELFIVSEHGREKLGTACEDNQQPN